MAPSDGSRGTDCGAAGRRAAAALLLKRGSSGRASRRTVFFLSRSEVSTLTLPRPTTRAGSAAARQQLRASAPCLSVPLCCRSSACSSASACGDGGDSSRALLTLWRERQLRASASLCVAAARRVRRHRRAATAVTARARSSRSGANGSSRRHGRRGDAKAAAAAAPCRVWRPSRRRHARARCPHTLSCTPQAGRTCTQRRLDAALLSIARTPALPRAAAVRVLVWFSSAGFVVFRRVIGGFCGVVSVFFTITHAMRCVKSRTVLLHGIHTDCACASL